MYIRTLQEKQKSKQRKRIRFALIILFGLMLSYSLGEYNNECLIITTYGD